MADALYLPAQERATPGGRNAWQRAEFFNHALSRLRGHFVVQLYLTQSTVIKSMKRATLRARTLAFSSFAVLSEALSPVVAPAVELFPSDVVVVIPEIDKIDFG